MVSSYLKLKKFLQELKDKPTLLLHSCCAPCSTHVITLLKDYFNITVFYSNDNIYPKEEFKKRVEEEKKFCELFSIPVIEDEYLPQDFNQAIAGYEHLGERSTRCYQCYKLRLKKTAMYAKEHQFEYFTTTLSISPYKISRWINEIGKRLEEEYGVPFLYSDFKKEEGYKHSIELSKQYDLYRQDYCGCLYSQEERRDHLNGKSEKNESSTFNH